MKKNARFAAPVIPRPAALLIPQPEGTMDALDSTEEFARPLEGCPIISPVQGFK